jgi:hypothetical protein
MRIHMYALQFEILMHKYFSSVFFYKLSFRHVQCSPLPCFSLDVASFISGPSTKELNITLLVYVCIRKWTYIGPMFVYFVYEYLKLQIVVNIPTLYLSSSDARAMTDG